MPTCPFSAPAFAAVVLAVTRVVHQLRAECASEVQLWNFTSRTAPLFTAHLRFPRQGCAVSKYRGIQGDKVAAGFSARRGREWRRGDPFALRVSVELPRRGNPRISENANSTTFVFLHRICFLSRVGRIGRVLEKHSGIDQSGERIVVEIFVT